MMSTHQADDKPRWVSGGEDGSLTIWDCETLEPLHSTPPGPPGLNHVTVYYEPRDQLPHIAVASGQGDCHPATIYCGVTGRPVRVLLDPLVEPGQPSRDATYGITTNFCLVSKSDRLSNAAALGPPQG
jgi:hypothetical protein